MRIISFRAKVVIVTSKLRMKIPLPMAMIQIIKGRICMEGCGAEVVECLICSAQVPVKIELSEEMRLKNINILGW